MRYLNIPAGSPESERGISEGSETSGLAGLSLGCFKESV